VSDKTAGGSAQAEYDRRAARHAEDLRQRRTRILIFAAAMTLVALAVAAVAQPIYGAVVLMLDLMLVMSALFTTPNSINAWQIGAEGEVRTARLLETLEADGFRVLHDRKIPGARSANIDHVVIGPPGIYVVETKSYKGSLQMRGDEVFVAGRPEERLDR
jgi:hypothetical protein